MDSGSILDLNVNPQAQVNAFEYRLLAALND